ncbi:MAG: signal recognition particle protein [Deltaproteobacteria bacterium]|nr:MAG: signal recognition particle protein [Deltaproteobacteria bacterium]
MFDAVRKGFTNARNVLEGKREITEENIEEALKAIRMALFEADVNFRVVKAFLNRVKEKTLGEVVHVRAQAEGEKLAVKPGDVFIKICHDELEDLMGPVDTSLTFVQERLGPTVVMMVGLQGAGKTTTTGKLARWLMHHQQRRPLLVACDVYRPAAVEQLRVLGDRLDVPVYTVDGGNPPDIAEEAVAHARATDRDVVLIDTAGRLAVDDLLMTELEEIVARVRPQNILLVVDAMIGQDAVNTAKEFNERLELDGFIMTKLDGDARGGAALSIKEVTGKPIKFVGMGEGMDALQEFQPSGFADRILGMGDIRSLVGRMENVITEQEAADREQDAERMLRGDFDLNDFLEQIRTIKKLGSLSDVMEMMPFGANLPKGVNIDDQELVRIEAMISSMTPEERSRPELVKTQVTRQRRIARGSGRKEREVGDLLQRFEMMRGMLGQFGQNQGGFLSRIPGFSQLAQLQQLKNTDFGDLFGAMGGAGGGGPGGGADPFGLGFPGQPQAPQLPRGYNPPGQRVQAESKAATRAKIDKDKARRRKQKSRASRKKGRKK